MWANKKINPEAPNWGVHACFSLRTSLWETRKAGRQHWVLSGTGLGVGGDTVREKAQGSLP